jgi:hypothetical protein
MLEVGMGVHRALSVPGTGRVVGAYGKAAYLQVPGGLFALTTVGVPLGPVHARTGTSVDRLRVADRVVVTPTLLEAGPLLLDLQGARLWQGLVPTAAELEDSAALAVELLDGAPASSLTAPPPVELLLRGDLIGLAACLGAVGPGLTPAGDDCLAGILFIARIRWGEPAAELLVRTATAVETNDVARAFLVWAARGQSIEPVHRFLLSAASHDVAEASRALASLVHFGHSSGADLALGLRLALQLLPGAPQPAARSLP